MKALYTYRRNSNISRLYLGYLAFFFVSTMWSQNIQQLEYFFGNDPGFGNGASVTATANSGDLTQNLSLPLTGLQEGFHRLTLRSKDTAGAWSLYEAVTFYIINEIGGGGTISNIAAAEYWFDTDPGLGNGTPLTISGSPNDATLNFAIPLGTLDVGFHKLGIRSKNLAGTWSLYEKKIFYIFKAEENLPPATLSGVEFLYDAALGFGTGALANLTITGNPDEYLVEIPTNLVSCDIHDLWLSIKNVDGMYSLYQIALDVDVFDNLPPTIVVFPNITAPLDAVGEASVTIDDVNNGTYDDCQLVSVVLNQTKFEYSCENLGANTVTVTATDAENKVSTRNVTITVVDQINPVAIAQNITVPLDVNGTVTISGNDLDNGSTDNCSVVTRTVNTSTFDCDDLGPNTVTLTVTDSSGNSNSTTAVVTVIDTTAPIAIAQNITIQLNATGTATISASDVNQSTDNCNIASSSLNITSFDCGDLGLNTVILTVQDQSGNTTTTSATVTVQDLLAPTVLTQNIAVQLDANGFASIASSDIENGSTDNCSIVSYSLNTSTFDCDDLGANTVILSVTDQSGTIGTATAVVTVSDLINPIAIGQNITVDLDGQSSVSILASDIDTGSSDNCSFTLSLDQDTFTMPGAYPVVLTVTDISGNQSSITVIVTVTDTTLGISEETVSDNSIKVFPIPTKNFITVVSKLDIQRMEIIDVNGRIISSYDNYVSQLDVSSLASGTYFIKFFTQQKSITKRIIKH